jgi:hypothetical protein
VSLKRLILFWKRDATVLEGEPHIIHVKPGGAQAESKLFRDTGFANP